MRSITLGSRARILAPLTLLAAARADVIVVDDDGPADFAEINVAIANSSNGDTILVRSGTYQAAPIIGRVVHVIADENANVVIEGYLAVVGLPAGELVVLAGLEVQPQAEEHFGLYLQDNQGAVRVQDCTFHGYAPPAIDTGGSTSQLEPGGDAVRIQSCADVSISRSAISGGEGQSAINSAFCLCYSGRGGAGVRCAGSSVALHDCTVNGGAGGEASYGGRGGTAVVLAATELYVSGGMIRGGDGGSIQDVIPLCEGGGHGIFAGTGSRARLLDVVVEGGLKSPFPGGMSKCDDGMAFAGNGTFRHLAPLARGLEGPRVVREGLAAQLLFHGEPGDVVYVARSGVTGHLFLPLHHGVWLLHFPPLMSTTPVGTIGSGGVLIVDYAPAPLASGHQARSELLQALHHSVADGWVLGAPRELELIDSSF